MSSDQNQQQGQGRQPSLLELGVTLDYPGTRCPYHQSATNEPPMTEQARRDAARQAEDLERVRRSDAFAFPQLPPNSLF